MTKKIDIKKKDLIQWPQFKQMIHRMFEKLPLHQSKHTHTIKLMIRYYSLYYIDHFVEIKQLKVVESTHQISKNKKETI